jgi:hypothetical protein
LTEGRGGAWEGGGGLLGDEKTQKMGNKLFKPSLKVCKGNENYKLFFKNIF